MKKLPLNTFFLILNSFHPAKLDEKGFSMVGWVFLVVFIFSVLVVTGSFNIDGKEFTYRTLSPTPGGGGPPSPPTADTTPSIELTLSACAPNGETNAKKGTVVVKGSKDGYLKTQIEDLTPGTFIDIGTPKKFLPKESTYEITLNSTSGFKTKKWKLLLYSGGTKDSSGIYSGGTIEATKDGDATGC